MTIEHTPVGAAPPPQRSRPGAGAPPTQPQVPRIELSIEEVDAATGVTLRRVQVEDVSVTSPTREANQRVLDVLDDMLRAHPEWAPPEVTHDQVVVGDNPVSQWLYSSRALQEWRRELVPSAMALYPVQRRTSHLPSGAAMDDMTQMVLRDSLDAIGIRTRAHVMAEVIRQSTRRQQGPAGCWVSLACGAAVPILEALRAVAPAAAHLTLVDLDPRALDFARRLARAQGLTEGRDFSVLQRDLVRGVVAATTLVEELGESSSSVVEALGIFEYFTDASCVRLLRNAYRLLAPRGVLVIGNMLADRPQLAFNQRGAGWPRLYPRSVEQLVDLVARAGLPLERTTISIPADGVYAVVDITA